MKQFGIALFLIFASILLSGCTLLGPATVEGSVIADAFIQADETVAKQQKSIIHFDVLQDKTLESFDQIFNAYEEANIPMEYNNTMGETSLIWFDSKELLIMQLTDSLEAGTFALQLNQQLEDEGYEYWGRVAYDDICNMYKKDREEEFYVLQKDRFVLLLKEKET